MIGPRMSDSQVRSNSKSREWLPVLGMALGIASACWVVGSRLGLPRWHGLPSTPLTTLCLLAATAAITTGARARYKWSIVAGLGFSAAGDAFLAHGGDRFVQGLASFLVAHICYLWALTWDVRLGGRRLPFALWGAFGAVVLPWLWPGIPASLRLPVVLYTATLMAMAAQATARAMVKRDASAIAAAVGGAHFAISDTVLAMQRFGAPLEWGGAIVLGTYFIAQGGLALSVLLARRGGFYSRV